jgi:hypothetical protein
VIRRLTDFWLDRPKLDFLIVLLVAGILGVANPHRLIPVASRATFYQTLATVSGVLLSVGTITITVFFAVAPVDRLDRVIEAVGPRLRRLVMSSLSGLVVTTAGFVGLFLLDHQTNRVRLIVLTALTTLTVLRFARLWWLLNAILAALTAGHPGPPPASWERPALQPTDYQVRRRRATRSLPDK